MFGDRFSSSTSCSRWLHETEPGRLDQSLSCRFLKVATHPLVLFRVLSHIWGVGDNNTTRFWVWLPCSLSWEVVVVV